MKELVFRFETNLNFSQPVTEHAFLLRCVPMQRPEQECISFMLDISPHSGSLSCGRDGFGNSTYSGYLAEAHSFFSYTVTGRVRRDDRHRLQAEPQPFYRYPSALTQPNAELEEFLSGVELTGDGLARARQLAKAVHGHFRYEPGTTDVHTSAGTAFQQGHGVCQDYTHVFLTLARLCGLPARYVSGLPLGDGASHAWAEVWHEGLWYGLDATRDCEADEGYIKLCVGRDFADCPLERGLFFGMAEQEQSSYMQVSELK